MPREFMLLSFSIPKSKSGLIMGLNSDNEDDESSPINNITSPTEDGAPTVPLQDNGNDNIFILWTIRPIKYSLNGSQLQNIRLAKNRIHKLI